MLIIYGVLIKCDVEISNDFILSVGGGMSITFVGSLSMVSEIKYKNKKKDMKEVEATITHLNTRRSTNNGHSNILSAPVFEYYYYGKQYVFLSSQYTNIRVPEVGSKEMIYVNDKDPRDVLIPSERKLQLPIVVSIIIILAGLCVIGFYLFN